MRIRELRKARRITQLKMALDLDMSQNTISRYESGEREPGIAMHSLSSRNWDRITEPIIR